MATTYCTSDDVANFLQLENAFSSSTTPTKSQVESWINEAEDLIDKLTNHAWREKKVENEYHDIPTRIVEGQVRWWTGLPIYLHHRKVRQFDSNQGDKLEIWNGGEWENWITNKTEGRNKDFWVDYEDGIIYLRNITPYIWKKAVRVTYRYGETSVPNDIKRLCVMMVAKIILTNEDRSVVMIGGETVNIPYSGKVEILDKQIKEILDRYREAVAVVY